MGKRRPNRLTTEGLFEQQEIDKENREKLETLTKYYQTTDFDKIIHVLKETGLECKVLYNVEHHLYPLYANGVHVFTLTGYVDGVYIDFNMIFNPVNGRYMCNDITFRRSV